AAHCDIQALVLGMAHRGRLNVLAHVFGKTYKDILAEFAEGYHVNGSNFEGFEPGWMKDVKYHQGARWITPSATGGALSLALLPNPSHLEMIGPVVQGAIRALQEDSKELGPPEVDHDAAMAVVIHGDAAFAGQGIISEAFNMSQLVGYDIGGTVHIVVNNQIGFTTDPKDTFSNEFCTDIAKGYGVPIVHVNADDVNACLSVSRLAFAYRQQFHKDIVIDLIGYRRFGHNEGDEPSFTQPVMYGFIQEHPTARKIWADQLVSEGVITEEEVETVLHEATAGLRRAMEPLSGSQPVELLEALMKPRDYLPEERRTNTAVPRETILNLNEELSALPEGFALNPKLERPLERRQQALRDEGRIDWGHAEALAFASILADGVPVRLTGQDTERGTFSQRHAVLHDVQTGERFVPLQAMPSARAAFSVHNSPLSEASALAYEYGYSVQAAGTLTLWEAQFGDFVNNAQGAIDEFIVSAYAKWGESSGLTLLLPHGFEGQGPDHSSAHIERFLQLCADYNIQVAYPTTAAQYFHLLRRQAAIL
ncbi:MAG: thiamine pyrophosphate-dependent enzyme, partial [Ardenticatenaceae bacterium]